MLSVCIFQVHAFIISHLKKEMPSVFGKDAKKKELIRDLDKIYTQLQREHQISPGDFPNIDRMRTQLQDHDFTKFHAIKPKLLENVDRMLSEDIATLMKMIPQEADVKTNQPVVKGGAFTTFDDSPFGVGTGEGADKGRGEEEWVVSKDRYKYDEIFQSLNPINGKITGAAAKAEMVKSRLPNFALGKVWKLSDIDRDGMLDADEFALSMHLINIKMEGHDIPTNLPDHLIPPSKRGFSP